MENLEDKESEKCIFYGKTGVRHFYDGSGEKPDCEKCDGYGEDARKNSWDCYTPKREFYKLSN